MANLPDVSSANLTQRIAMLDDGRSAPITNMVDCTGDETDDPAECWAFVCGPIEFDGHEKWLAVEMSKFDRVTRQ